MTPAELPEGFVLLQIDPEYAAQLDANDTHWYGWLFYRHPDGQWVSHRKLEDWEIMQAEDQRDLGIVINGQRARYGK